MSILTEDKGSPSNWEVNLNSVQRVGLAVSPNVLSMAKISALANHCDLLDNFYLSSYRLRIYDSTHQILLCGYNNLEPPLSSETRHVIIGGEYGNVTLDMW